MNERSAKISLFFLIFQKKIFNIKKACNNKCFKAILRILQMKGIGIIFQKNYLRIEKSDEI
ncbi:MAG TPA: hypothetical protein DEB71_10270 [Chryseobacterium carnipullorum]|nr:hypothetical protein [Chryseobacterium carnipullorum]